MEIQVTELEHLINKDATLKVAFEFMARIVQGCTGAVKHTEVRERPPGEFVTQTILGLRPRIARVASRFQSAVLPIGEQ